MSPLARQIYTNVSLAAMVPAVIWSASAYSAHSLVQVIGGFPFYYLAVSQLLVLPRYIAGAIVIEKLGKSKRFSVKGGIIGLLTSGAVIDIWLTVAFAGAIADTTHAMPFVIPITLLPAGFIGMLAVAVITGYVVRRNRPALRKLSK